MFETLNAASRSAAGSRSSTLVSVGVHAVAVAVLTVGTGAMDAVTEQVTEGVIFLAPPPTVTAGPRPYAERIVFTEVAGLGGDAALAGAGGFADAALPGEGIAVGGRPAGADPVTPTLQEVSDDFLRQADSVYLSTEVDNPVAYDAASAAPAYPDSLRAAGVEGWVEAEFVVDTTGHVEPGSFVLLESTHGRFTESVRAAMPNMLFRPAQLGGRKIKQLVRIPFVFRITPTAAPASDTTTQAAADTTGPVGG